MKRLWTVILTTGLVVAFASTAAALAPELSSARSAALGGHDFIQDVEDVYTFPQLSLDHRGVVQANSDGTDTAGSGLVLFGNERMTYGAGIHAGAPDVPNTIDAFFAMPMGDNSLGFQLSLGLGGSTATPKEGDKTGNSLLSLGVGAGYSMGAIDLGLGFQMANTTTLGGHSDGGDLTTGGLGAGLSARSVGDNVDGVAWGWSARMGYVSFNVGEQDAHSVISLGGGYGPVLSVEGATAALQATLGVELTSDDDNTDDETDATAVTTISVPGLELATEYAVNDWLTVRGSAGYQFDVTMTSNPDESSSQTMDNGDGFTWAAGAGAHFGNLNIDAVLQSGFLVSGPDFIGGAGGGLASQVSATYRF